MFTKKENTSDDYLYSAAEPFQDSAFRTLKLYHWITKISYDLITFIDININYTRKFQKGELQVLLENAHPKEKRGIQKWMTRLSLEIDELELLQRRMTKFRDHVIELVSGQGYYPLQNKITMLR